MKLFIYTIAVGIYLVQVEIQSIKSIMFEYSFYKLFKNHFIQACLAAPRTYTDEDIEDIGFEPEGDVDLEAKLAESIMATLKKYKNNPVNASFFLLFVHQISI